MNRCLPGLAAALSLAFLSAQAADDDFRPLFNGKDLTGWITPDDASIFSVENGEIVGRTKEGQLLKNEFLVTDKNYGNFVLRAKVKIRNGNSGIQIRSKRASNGAVAGPQADIADDYWGSLYYEGVGGRLFRYPQEYAKELVRAGDWNEMVITAKGKQITTTLNGRIVFDCTDPQFESTGVIGLQVHRGPPMEVRYKDVQIKVLD
jgi:3-keto-disaccharide hydrolase